MVPFELANPSINDTFKIRWDNLLDTLSFEWTDSYNFLGESYQFKLFFEDSLGYMNNDENISIFNDSSLFINKAMYPIIDIYRKMDSLNILSTSFIWEVNITDSLNVLASNNGPFEMTISREIYDLEKPIISMNIESKNFSRETIISYNSVYVNQVDSSLKNILDYSFDNGETWLNEFDLETTNSIVSINHNWNVLEKFGWGLYDTVELRAYTIVDSVYSDTLFIYDISIINIVGDFIYYPENEIGIKANDISDFITVFYQQGNSVISKDIGPSTGIAPYLQILPDGIINFEDLATFTQMWYWSAENYHEYPQSTSDGELVWENQNVSISSKLNKTNESVKKEMSFSIDLKEELSFMGINLHLKYNPNNLLIDNIDIGHAWNQDKNPSIIFKKHRKSEGYYIINAWSKENQPIVLNNNLFNITLGDNQSSQIIDKIEIIIEPYKDRNIKDEVSKYIIEADLNLLFPENIFLSNNYPNPFNPTTHIDYKVSSPALVELKVYDLVGREVITLVNKYEQPGLKTITWNGTDSYGIQVSSGMYFYTIKSMGKKILKKMILLK